MLLCAWLGVAACDSTAGTDGATTIRTPAAGTASTVPPLAPVTVASGPTASATPPATPATPPPTEGEPSEDCVDGWVTPPEGSPEWTSAIGVIRRTAPFAGEAVVVDMRMFVGPESPPSDKGYLKEIRRWYVKLYAADDATYQGRFLVERRRFGQGVAAVAPYDTEGFRSPDWVGFQWEIGAKPERYERLPGRWEGTPYDFVNGGAGLTIPGLPAEVRGCLTGT